MFLATVTSGGSFAVEGALNLAEVIKQLRPRSSSFQQAWLLYCTQHGGGMNDPLAHNNAFINGFFQVVTQSYVRAEGQDCGGAVAAMTMGEPMMKKMKMSVPAMGSGGDPQKEALVQAVKDFTKSSPGGKELWCEYAKAYLGGNFDPNRHEATVLQEFLVNHQAGAGSAAAMAGLGGLGGMGGMGALAGMGGMGGMGSMSATLASMFGLAAGGGGGMTAGLAGAGGAGAGGAEKVALVERVKAHSRTSRENAEMWSIFCSACGGVKDPNRHEVAKLQEFCALNGC